MSRRQTRSFWWLTMPCVLALLLGAAGCQSEQEVAADSTLQAPPATVTRPEPQPPKTVKRSKPGSPAGIAGAWVARLGNLGFTIELAAEGRGLKGFVSGPGGAVTPIKIGVFSGDAFLFETTTDGTGWLWSGELSADGLKGHRENLQTGAVETFTAQRSE